MRERLDLTCQRYGKLVVLRPAEKIGGKTAWVCRCDCGREITVKTYHLRDGHTKSCGCAGPCSPLDLTGQRFGRLTVLRRAENIGSKTAWVCRCDCGNEKIVKTTHLRSGGTKTCGCLQRENNGRPLGVTFVDGTCVEVLASDTMRRNNTSGVTGVNWMAKKHAWRAELCFKGKNRYLGLYHRFEDAVKARKRAEEELIEPFLREYAGTETRNVNDNFDAVNARNRT